MKLLRPIAFFILPITLIALVSTIVAQNGPDPHSGDGSEDGEVIYKKPTDHMRKCENRAEQPIVQEGELIFYSTSWGNNPQEGVYRQEMERLLKIEINNVNDALEDIEKKHREFVQIPTYAKYRFYQEIILEDEPGTWRGGDYINSKKLIIFHYNEEQNLDCVVLDSIVRSIYHDNSWTRKILRLYVPNVQTVEIQTMKHNYNEHATLDRTSPEVQLKALRGIFLSLRAALYAMDMYIAAYYDKRNRINSWQIDI
ncbi:MAG: hypothetical protein KDK27_14140 [Leptospiraceae bacterium]|nr:hypothetical protein [Leptospiraceae bacterium]